MLIAMAAAVLLLAQAAPTEVSAPAAAAAPAAKATKPEKPKMICRDEIQTGSKFSRRICMTPEEFKAQEDAARDQSNAMRACKTGMGC